MEESIPAKDYFGSLGRARLRSLNAVTNGLDFPREHSRLSLQEVSGFEVLSYSISKENVLKVV